MLKIGIIGLSLGNGHPYSWSAIFNGFNNKVDCPFEVIPEYLVKQKYPEDFLSDLGKVTHIWTQDRRISELVAQFSFIENVVDSPKNMLNEVDAILLARDDAENHYEMAKFFIEKSVPVFIDKPLAFSLAEAKKIFSINKKSLVYTCSSMRFAKEFSDKITTGTNYINAVVMKSWEKYGIHIIEPVVSMFPNRGHLISVKKFDSNIGVKIRVVEWENLLASFTITDKLKTPIKIDVSNSEFSKTLILEDVFYAFRESLRNFIYVIEKKKSNILESETLEIIEIIEKGK